MDIGRRRFLGTTISGLALAGLAACAAYPEHTMFGVLPAHALWVRHAARITVRDVRFGLATPDARPAVALDDVVASSITTPP